MEWKKGLIAGIVAGIVFTIISYLSMLVPGTSEWYQQTFPQMMTVKAIVSMTASTFIVGLFMGMIYAVINSAVPGEGVKKGAYYGFMVFLVGGLMWPIMMIGFASAYMWITEMIRDFVVYILTGIVVALIYLRIPSSK